MSELVEILFSNLVLLGEATFANSDAGHLERLEGEELRRARSTVNEASTR